MVMGEMSPAKWMLREEKGSSVIGIVGGAVRVIWNAEDSPTWMFGVQKMAAVST